MRISDWSSDVCSSDLRGNENARALPPSGHGSLSQHAQLLDLAQIDTFAAGSSGRASSMDRQPHLLDRKSVVSGKSVSVRVDLGGSSIIKKKKIRNQH